MATFISSFILPPSFILRFRSIIRVTAVHAKAGLQLVELLCKAIAGRVDVFGFGDELQIVIATDLRRFA